MVIIIIIYYIINYKVASLTKGNDFFILIDDKCLNIVEKFLNSILVLKNIFKNR